MEGGREAKGQQPEGPEEPVWLDGGRWASGLSLAAPRYCSPPGPCLRGWDGVQWEQLPLAQVRAEVSDPPATRAADTDAGSTVS